MEADDKFLNMGILLVVAKLISFLIMPRSKKRVPPVVKTWPITFLIGPEVSAHFFKASESDLSQQEVYQFHVPTFGPGVVFDVDYSVRQEQFRFFTESLRVNKLKGYVDQIVTEAESKLKFGE
ncbi:Sterol 14-demethylase [Hibiscus syriacus]|uniref:Sterol 14-demethylase n=1 Tax=Hibiscus syriacus TaxID=106335 RepID=A0A6A2Z4E8_HIBSY|nr:Sterol 14-demethylase [Hibiscus syriacus]